MKKRNPLAVFFLSIITLGIYDIYWLVVTKKVLNQKTKNHVPTIWMVVAPGLALAVLYIVLIASVANNSSTVTNYGYTTTTPNLGHPAYYGIVILLTILSWLAFAVLSIIWTFKFSKAVNEYTGGKMSTAVTFLILWLIHLIGVALVQDTFNDMADNGSVPQNGVPQPVAVSSPNTMPPVTAPENGPSQLPPSPPVVTPPSPPVNPTA